MPYIAIKGYPKDEETYKRVVEKVNAVFVEEWGCPPEAICISVESVAPEAWNDTVVKTEIEPKRENMMIFNGKKNY